MPYPLIQLRKIGYKTTIPLETYTLIYKQTGHSTPRVIIILFFFTVLFPFSSSSRWRCHHPQDAEIIREIYEPMNLTLTLDCCRYFHTFICNPNTSRVQDVNIAYRDYSGKIPDAIAKFTGIYSLRLYKLPNVHGEIPPPLSNLVNLRSLTISWTNVTGPVPGWLHRLTNLHYLDLSFNQLTGSVPPFLGDLPWLTDLRLDRNRLSGQIPESLGRLGRAATDPVIMRIIKLGHNELIGAVPRSLGDADFWEIQLQRNRLTGDPSHLFNGRSKRLSTIDLSRNLFDFDLSKIVFPTGELVNLDFSHNAIRCSIPSQLFESWRLMNFNVSYNRLCGKIPPALRDFGESAYMHNRCLCGPPLYVQC